jgi:hypothetical protein
MLKSPKSLVFGTAFLLAGLPALAAEESGVAPLVAAPAARASINCPGISSVPMTADAAQALPLRILASLGCGQPVAILSDNEGYTAHVRTADGKEGYVARMYLTMSGSASNPNDQALSSATPVNNVVRWQAGAPGCDQFMSKGHTVESATARGITVQVSLEDTGWKLRATIALSNKSKESLEILPGLITLDELQPGLKALLSQDGTKLSHVVNHQVFLTQANAQPSPSAVTFRGVIPPTGSSAAYHPPTPDYFTEHVVPASAGSRAGIVPTSAELQSLSLKHARLESGQKTVGVIWFERDANARELSLRVPVGDLVFDFPLSFEKK